LSQAATAKAIHSRSWDKAAAQILVFGGDGRLRGAAPALFGSATGDHSAPGIAGLALREIPGRDRTTPAGRFVGGFGPSTDAGRVLWVDYDSAVSIHPVATGVPAERRPERLASPSPDDNRITHGCINVSPDFYEQILRPTFERGGVFYILPDTAPLAETFPSSRKVARMWNLKMEDAHGPATSEGRVGGSAVVLCVERSLTGAGRSRSCQRPLPTQAGFGAMSTAEGRPLGFGCSAISKASSTSIPR
jgi:hypothetical protein